MTDCGHLPIIAELRQEVAAGHARIALLEATVASLLKKIEDLEARVNRNSRNSSTPPSADPPNAPSPSPKKPSGRKPGGQPGHPGHHRAKRDPDKVVDHVPEVCGHCGCPLSADDDLGDPACHQVEELPPVRPTVTEHRCRLRRCRNCGKKTRATLPAGVPAWHFGPRVMTAVAVLSSKFRLTRRELPKVLEDFFGLTISVGTIQKLNERTSEVMADPTEAIAEVVHTAPVVNADETGCPHRGKKSWLWVATCPNATLFRIHRRRGAEGLATLMPDDYDGLLIVDRWKPYERFRRSLCHAHLLRNWQEVSERKDPEAKRLGKWAVAPSRLPTPCRDVLVASRSSSLLARRMARRRSSCASARAGNLTSSLWTS